FGIDAGIENPIRFGIYDATGTKELHDYGKNEIAPYMGLRIFLSIPQ
ncbi:MAG: hypothetical protein ACI959_000652, partial [Limisphaerales bacterium]